MLFEDIFKDVATSFNSLWNFKVRGDTLEIITPFTTTSNKFISLFLTKRKDEFIVSDGNWIENGNYDIIFDRESDCFNKVFYHYLQTLEIKEVANSSGATYFYKKTKNQITVPSLILDLASFVSTIVSISNIEFATEKESKELFRRSANDYIKSIVQDNFYTNEYLDTKKQVKVSGIVKKQQSRLVILNFITGSNYQHFRNSISKTNILFEMADKTEESNYIDKKVSFIDDQAVGFQPERVSFWLGHLGSKSERVNWSSKEKLIGLLN